MNIITKIGLFVLLLTAGWHFVVATTDKISLCGAFRAKPSSLGYVWANDTTQSDARFFWQITRIRWQPGLLHPEFNVTTSEEEGVWNPLPGYKFIDKTKGLTTTWEAGLQHPDYMAWSDDVEGLWIPVTGYRFIYDGDTFVDSVWDPGKRYDDLKVISLQQKDHYKPFPGYKFLEPGKSLSVIWVPGLVNSDNSRLVAGIREGTWKINYHPSRSHRPDNVAAWVIGGIAAAAILNAL